MKDTWNKVFDKFDQQPNQKEMLNLILGNPQVATYLTEGSRSAELSRVFEDPIGWFYNIAQPGTQLTKGGGGTKAVEARRKIEDAIEMMQNQQNGNP